MVSQCALEPATYRFEYATVDGRQGAATLLAIDVAHDLAVVHLDKIEAAGFFEIADNSATHDMPKAPRRTPWVILSSSGSP